MMAFEGTSVGAVWAQLKLDMTQFNEAVAGVSVTMMNFGTKLTKLVTIPLLGIGVASGKMYTDFELTMNRMIGLVGLTKDQVDTLSEAVLKMAPALGKAPQELADALYYITSSGITDVADALDVLDKSAKAAASGLGTTKVVADAVTSAINAYGKENITAGQATDILTAAVKYGKVEADEFAPALGRVIAVASSMGIGFDQVAGAMAAMSRVGFSAAEAATSLTAIMSTMLKPTSAATDALAKHGLTMAELRDTAQQPGGLIDVLRLLNTTFDGNDEELAQVIPNIRALRGVMNLLSQDSATVDEVLQGVTNSVGTADTAFQAYKQTNQALIDTALVGIKASLVEIGGVVMPMVADAIDSIGEHITRFADWWADLDDEQKKFIVTAAGVVAAIGPVIAIIGLVGSTVSKVIGIFSSLGPVIGALTSPVGLVIASITALTAGIVWLSDHWEGIWKSMKESSNPIIKSIVSIIDGITAAIQSVIEAVKDVIGWFARWKENAKGLQSAVDAAFPTGGGVSGKVTTVGQIGGHASGGYFTTPHIAVIAEQEPEWVVPQSQAGTFAAQMGGSANEALLRELTFQVKQLQQVVMNSGAGVVSAIRG